MLSPYISSGNAAVDGLARANILGRTIPSAWYKTVTTASGRPNRTAIEVLSVIVAWHRPKQQLLADGRVQLEKQFAGDLYCVNYGTLEGELGISNRTARRALTDLEEIGVIHRHIRPSETHSTDVGDRKITSVLYLELDLARLMELTYPEPDKLPHVAKPMGLGVRADGTVENPDPAIVENSELGQSDRGYTAVECRIPPDTDVRLPRSQMAAFIKPSIKSLRPRPSGEPIVENSAGTEEGAAQAAAPSARPEDERTGTAEPAHSPVASPESPGKPAKGEGHVPKGRRRWGGRSGGSRPVKVDLAALSPEQAAVAREVLAAFPALMSQDKADATRDLLVEAFKAYEPEVVRRALRTFVSDRGKDPKAPREVFSWLSWERGLRYWAEAPIHEDVAQGHEKARRMTPEERSSAAKLTREREMRPRTDVKVEHWVAWGVPGIGEALSVTVPKGSDQEAVRAALAREIALRDPSGGSQGDAA